MFYIYLYILISICSEILKKIVSGEFIISWFIRLWFESLTEGIAKVRIVDNIFYSILFVFVGLPIYLIFIPFFLITELLRAVKRIIFPKKQNLVQSDKNVQSEKNIPPAEERIGVHMAWRLNPFYHKLIFSLNNEYVTPNSLEIEAIKTKYSDYDNFVLPIIHDFKLLNRVIYKNNFREDLERNKYGLYVLESNRCIDEIPNDTSVIFDSFSNINYSNFGGWKDIGKQEVSAWFLSELLNIDNDGIDKLVFWSKNDLRKLKVISLHEFKDGFNESLVEGSSISILIEKYDIHKLLSFYLCLKWKHSGLPENESLRISSKIIKKEFLDEFSSNNNLLNWVELIEYKSPAERGILYRSKHIEKESAIESKLKDLENETFISYKSRIFLKTANMACDLIKDDEVDFSILAIGYTKFFESEIKLSILPFIRKELGVSMPDFYNAHCPGNKNYILELNDSFKVDFNQKNRFTGKLIPPGLGQILNSYNFLNTRIVYTKISHREFNKITKELNRIRNRSAHAEIVSSDDAARVREIIVRLYKKKVFKDFYSVKVKLSSQS